MEKFGMALEAECVVEGITEFQAAMRNFDSATQRHVHRKLVSWAADVKALARRRAPVRTGHLRDSIYAEVKEWIVRIGAEATYAFFVEFGTRYMRARPYIYPAVQQYLPVLEEIICEAIEEAKAEAGL